MRGDSARHRGACWSRWRRRCGSRRWPRRTRRRSDGDVLGRQAGGRVARRHARRVHSRLEPLGPRHEPPARRKRSRPTVRSTSATPPTTQVGVAAIARSSRGRRIRKRSRHSSRTSARSARCTSSPTVVGHPTLRVAKFPLPGDPVMAMVHRVVIDVGTGTMTRLQMPPDYHRATLGDDLSMNDYNWSPDGSKLAHRVGLARPQARLAERRRHVHRRRAQGL